MKVFISALLALGLVSNQTCQKQKPASAHCFKGRLEIKGICSNYTIKLLEGDIDPSKIEASWTDEHTQKTYTNVFALGSPCTFPDSIQEGEAFYFVLDNPPQNCMVCQAYYPKPQKALSLKVVKSCP